MYLLKPNSAIRRCLKTTRFRIGLVMVGIIVFIALFAPFIALYPQEGYGYIPFEDISIRRLQPPSLKHPFGTDSLGRDLFSRVIIGTRLALIQSIGVISISLIIGTIVGASAAYFRGVVEKASNYLIELFMAIPAIIIALFLRMTIGQGLQVVVIALVLTWWAWYARISYVYAKSIVDMEYVTLARLSGLGHFTIITRHVLRNMIQPVLVQAVSDIGSALLEASAINFMGLGLEQGSPEWGIILYEAIFWEPGAFIRAPLLAIIPGVFILVTTLGFSLVADPLRETLDPKLGKRWRLWF